MSNTCRRDLPRARVSQSFRTIRFWFVMGDWFAFRCVRAGRVIIYSLCIDNIHYLSMYVFFFLFYNNEYEYSCAVNQMLITTEILFIIFRTNWIPRRNKWCKLYLIYTYLHSEWKTLVSSVVNYCKFIEWALDSNLPN